MVEPVPPKRNRHKFNAIRHDLEAETLEFWKIGEAARRS